MASMSRQAVTVRCWSEQSDEHGRKSVYFDVLNGEGKPAITNGYMVTF